MNEHLMSEPEVRADNPFGYSTFFEHFNFSQDDKINSKKVSMLEEIYDFFLTRATRMMTSPLYELSMAERTIDKSVGVSLLQLMTQYVRINKSIEASMAELNTLQK